MNMKKSYLVPRGLLGLICIYHVSIGVIAFLPSETVGAAASAILGLALPEEPALFQVIKSFGVYAFVFGVMMGLAAYDPVKNRAMITAGVVLFALRIGQRLANLDELEQSFGVSEARNLGTVAVVGALGLALAWFRWRLWRDMRAGGKVRDEA
jgi:hypothetical protein